jgi:prevent-host-death family protein
VEAHVPKDIGVRELKIRASAIIRGVAEQHATYTVTRRGRPVGTLAPLDLAPPAPRGRNAAWTRLFEAAERIAAGRRPSRSAVRDLERSRR